MKRINLFTMLLVLVFANALRAQDPHFSQYFNSPFTLNPAFTGKNVGDWRVMGVFRSQWWGSYVEPYNTTSISVEKSIATGTSQKSTLGFGASLLNDASNGGLLKNNYAGLHTAFNLSLDKEGNQQLGIGISGIYANRLLNLNMFEYQSQFGSMGFQRNTPSNEVPAIDKNSYIDFNVGILYSEKQENIGYHLGAALFHAARPVQGAFKNSTYSLDQRLSFQGGIQWFIKNGNELDLSSVVDMQGSNKVVSLGAVYKIQTHAETVEKFNLGLWNRMGDAWYPYVGVEGKDWLFALSYDVVTSRFKDANNSVQSMELSVAWLFGKKKGEGSLLRY